MEQPSLANHGAATKSFSTACGVSTEVGSSRIKELGRVSSARTISTRWRSPTLSVHGPHRVHRQAIGLRDLARPGHDLGQFVGAALSRPEPMFSAAVSVSNSEKCW